MTKYISPCLLSVGVLTLVASGFVGYYVVPYKIWENIMEQSKIVRGNTRFNNWERIPIPLFQRIYFFNVTNPEDVIKGGKPILQELGPYVYQQKREKFHILFNEDNGTIFYREKMDMFFRADLSNGSESDPLTFINLPFVNIGNKVTQLDAFTRFVITQTLSKYPKEKLYLSTTIGEIMFGGRYLPYIKDLAELNGEEILLNNTFGLYYGLNGTDQGRFEIYSGVKHPERFGDVASWNGMKSLDWYEDEYCNQMNGSDGIFQPYATKARIFYMFIPGLCKSFRFDYEGEGEVKGIPVNKHSLSPRFFESAKTNPDNACFCGHASENLEKCPESGVFSMEKCGKGAMMLSQPHFYQGSALYLNQSIGLHPDKERHEMALYIETYTSAPAQVKLRFQMNIDLQPNNYIRSLKKIPRMIHPLFWIDQNVEMPDDKADLIRDKLYGTIYITHILTHLGIILGIIFIIFSFLTFFMCTTKKKEEKQGKIECVSYHPQGTLPKSATNGKIPNGFNHAPHRRYEAVSEANGDLTIPFLKQNGHAVSSPSNGISAAYYPRNELIVTFCTEDDDDDISDIANDINSKNSHFPLNNSQNHIQPSDEPDSRVSPFPVVKNDSSLLSTNEDNIVVNNTPRELVEATSSYENL